MNLELLVIIFAFLNTIVSAIRYIEYGESWNINVMAAIFGWLSIIIFH